MLVANSQESNSLSVQHNHAKPFKLDEHLTKEEC